MNLYGYCPACFAEVVSRTRGGPQAKDTCARGHRYLAAYTLPTALLREWAELVSMTLGRVRDRLDPANGFGDVTMQERRELAQQCHRMLNLIPVTETRLNPPADSA